MHLWGVMNGVVMSVKIQCRNNTQIYQIQGFLKVKICSSHVR